jgi:hypothetical protein
MQSFFSTVFVNMQPPTGNNNDDGKDAGLFGATGGSGSQLVVYKHTWIAIVTILIMSCITGGWFWVWDRRRPRTITSNPSKC